MTGMTPRDQRKLARAMGEIAQLRRRVEQQSRSQNLAHSTIVQGEGPQIVTPEGEVIGQVGGTPDGALAPVGPVPDAPSAPTVDVGLLSARVIVTDPWPAGVALAQVWASTDPAEPGSPVGAIPAGSDATSVALDAGLWHVRLVWVLADGRTSEPSPAAMVDAVPLVDSEDIKEVLAAAQSRLDEVRAALEARRGTVPPTEPDTEGRVYYQVDDTNTPVAVWRYTDGQWVPVPLEDAVFVRVSTDQLVAGMALIGGTLIENGAVTSDKINANEVWASEAFLGAARASNLVLTATSDGITSQVSGAGIEVFRVVTEDDGVVHLQPLTRFGSFADSTLTTLDPATGQVLAAIGADGSGSFQSLTVDSDPMVQGVPLVGAVSSRHDSGNYATGLLDGLPWGRVGYAWRDGHSSPQPGGETGILEVRFMAQPGRTYRITAETGGLVANSSLYYGRIRRMIGSSAFSSLSFISAQTQWDSSGGGQHSIVMTSTTEGPADLDADPVDTRLLLSVYNPTDVQWTANPVARRAWIEVEDVGPRRGNTGFMRSTAISRTDNSAPPEPTQPPSVQSYTTKVAGTQMRSYYRGGGSIQTTGLGATMLKQGQDPSWPSGGLQASMWLIDKSALAGRTSGSTVTSATLNVRSAYASTGGSKRIRLYWHELTSLQSSFPSASLTLVGEYTIGEYARLSIALPASVRTAISQGRLGGFALGTAGSTFTRYALGLSWSDRPTLTVKYEK